MNKNCYRHVFNKARGIIMVVAEIVRNRTKSPKESHKSGSKKAVSLSPLTFALRLSLGLIFIPISSWADIVADKSAPENQQATILNAPNNVPLVNIQTPNKSGVSRNTYSQFDVQQKGAILNNSRTNVQTQLGGWVQGNPWLANGSARIILNEVNSNNPSHLNGYVEIAGQKAQVVIANPAGITCSNCGFINANRATITTGKPIINGGNLEGYRVEGGTIHISGTNGMDTSSTDYTDLIAQSVEVNANIWAQNLKVTTGTNQVNADNTQVNKINSASARPSYAIDVAQLGGMYAGKITLIGTEEGVGVRHAGTMGASIGDVTISADGQLTSSGNIWSEKAKVSISTTGDIQQTGNMYAGENLTLTTKSNLENTGNLHANNDIDIFANGADSHVNSSNGSEIAAGVSFDGILGDQGNITITTSNTLTLNGKKISGSNQKFNAETVDLSNSQASAKNIEINTSQGSINLADSSIESSQNLVISSGSSLNTDSAYVGAQKLAIQATSLSNKQGQIIQAGGTDLAIKLQGDLDNTQGSISSNSANITLDAAQIINNDGEILHAENGKLALNSSAISNHSGNITSAGSLQINSDVVDNTDANLLSEQQLTITSQHQINNIRGLISSTNQHTQLLDKAPDNKTLNITNTDGTLFSGQNLNIDSASLSGDGALLSEEEIQIQLTNDFTHSGEIYAQNAVQVHTTGTLDNQSTISAQQQLALLAATINLNASSELIAGSINLIATDSNTLNNRGLINATQTEIDTITLNNLGTGRIYGDQISINATTLNNLGENGQAPVIAARTQLDIGAENINNRDHALLFSAGDLSIGGYLDQNQSASGQAQTLNNTSATIESLGNMHLGIKNINNINQSITTEEVVSAPVKIVQWKFNKGPDVVTRYAPDEVTFLNNYREKVDYLLLKKTGFREDGFTKYEYNRTVSETVLTASDPAQILASGTLSIDSESVFNDKSQILSGQDIVANIDTIENISATGTITTKDRGTSYYYRRKEKDKPAKDRTKISTATYSPAARVQTITLAPATYEANAAVSGTNTQVAAFSPITQYTLPADQPDITHQVLTGGLNHQLPGSSLFTNNPDAPKGYIVETDPNFASYQNWLSSDYLLNALAIDPTTTQKRLGDGFYEQKLIREQVAMLTGRRFLDGYSDEQQQYQQLMSDGALFAQAHSLQPGIELSPEQMAQLTSDIVWLVEKTITLENGDAVQALVPQLYVRVNENDLSATGGLIAADNQVNLNIGQDLNNMGIIAGRRIAQISANNINNLGGSISGESLTLNAMNDIANIGGAIKAEQGLNLNAGRDLINETTTSTQQNQTGSQTNIDRIAGLYVSDTSGLLNASAGRDLILKAAAVESAGQSQLSATNDILISSVTEKTNNKVTWNKKNHSTEFKKAEVGSNLQSNNGIQISAGRNITIHASTVASEAGQINVNAAQDITLSAGQYTEGVKESFYQKKSGAFSSSSKQTSNNVKRSSLQSTTLSGNDIQMQSGRDTLITGSDVIADENVNIRAGQDINIQSGQQHRFSQQIEKEKESGLMGSGGIGVTLGSRKQSDQVDQTHISQRASTIGAMTGDIHINANNDATIEASDLLAKEGNIHIEADNVTLKAADNTFCQNELHKFEQSGVTVALSGGVIDTAQTIQNSAKRIQETDNSKLKALHAWRMGRVAEQLPEQVDNLDNLSDDFANPTEAAEDASKSSGINLSLSLGASKSEQTRDIKTTTAQGSTVFADGEVTITARNDQDRADQHGDINSQGTRIDANTVTLDAANNINLTSSENTHSDTTKSENSSAGIGISIGSDGLQLYVEASRGEGNINQSSDQYLETQINANEQVSIHSGQDTTLKGAQVTAKQITANIGGDLNIISQHDEEHYRNREDSIGGRLGVGIGANTPVNASLNASQLKADYDYRSVQQQSGFFAGEEGYQFYVENNTDLQGGMISSKAEKENNQLSTATLTTSDLQNRSTVKVEANHMGISTDMMGQGKYSVAKVIGENTLLNADKEKRSKGQTLSTLTEAEIEIRDDQKQIELTGASSANTLNKINKNADIANKVVNKQNINSMQESAEEAKAYQTVLYQEAIKFTDESYRTMFLKQAKVVEVMRDEDGNIKYEGEGENKKPRVVELTEEQKQNLKPGESGKVNIFTNGIFNDMDAAAEYTIQNSEVPIGESVYLVHFPDADNALSEILVAGYQKYLEGGNFDLANATQETKNMMERYGSEGLYQIGHSRGAMTIGNAMRELKAEGKNGVLNNTSMRYVGPADNAQEAANHLYDLSNGNTTSIELQNHTDDWVGTMIGGNAPTYEEIDENSNHLIEKIRVVTGEKPTVHSCYGTGTDECINNYGKAESETIKAKQLKGN